MNISRSGIAFSTLKPLSDNSEVELNLTYPEQINRMIPSKVKIIWSHRGKVLNAYGASFVDIHPEDKADLLDLFYQHWKERVIAERKIITDNTKKWLA
jgi:hypothetical protein